MNTFDDIQQIVLSLSSSERGQLAVAVLDSLDDEPFDADAIETWSNELLARSDAYSRGDLKAVDWRQALAEIEADLETRVSE